MPYDPEWHRQFRENNREFLRQRSKEYRQTSRYKEVSKIHIWKKRGIRCDEEWGEVYDWWLNAKTCDICDKEFVNSKDRCLDHDHILEGYNVRGILCKKCNYYKNEL